MRFFVFAFLLAAAPVALPQGAAERSIVSKVPESLAKSPAPAALDLGPEAEAKPGEPAFDEAMLTAGFTDPGALEAAGHLRANRGSAALTALPANPKDPPTRFLRALALAMVGDDTKAAAAFEALAPDYPALGARCRCLAADSFERIGDSAAAARNLEGCAQDPARGKLAIVQRARNLSRSGQGRQGLAELAPLIAGTGWLRNEALFMAGQLQEALGELAPALASYRTLFLDDPMSPLAVKARERAKDLVRRVKVPPLPESRLADRAERLLAANQIRLAVAAVNELSATPICTGAACAPKRCQPLPSQTPVIVTPTPAVEPPPAETPAEESTTDETIEGPAKKAKPFSVAAAKDDEISAPLAKPACLVEMAEKPADPLTCRLQLLRGWAARKTRANQKALDLVRPVYERCADADVRAKALYIAQAAAAAVRDPDALDLAVILGLQFPTHSMADDALMAASGMARDRGDRPLERVILRQLITAHPESDQRAEALFRLFWSHRSEGRPDRGLAALETLWKEYDAGLRGDGGDAERGRYWWGWSVAKSALPAERQKGLDRLVDLAQERPLTYYGLLARSQLGAQKPPVIVTPKFVEPHTAPLRLGALATDRAFLAALELWRLGFQKEARESLLAVDFRPLRTDGRRGREATLLVCELFRRLGDDRTAHAFARRELLKNIREGLDPLARRASLCAYPLAFRDHVTTYATRAGFPPDFLQGLMREESALDPKAKSPVGARGLTQVMPATGRQVAKSVGLRFTPDDLWVPEKSIQIGSIYLGRMLKSFGHPGLAAAAYNAGPGAVNRWLVGANGPFDEFVEEIPFSETRGYVKRVLRSYGAYSFLYEPATPAMRVSLLLREGVPAVQ